MMQLLKNIKGYIAGGVALIACPCHLPITLPALIGLTAGTAFSGWLSNNMLLIGVASSALFIGSLFLAGIWLGENNATETTLETNLTPEVTFITSTRCSSCEDARNVWDRLRQTYPFKFVEVDIFSERGRELAAKYNVFSTPASLINGQVVLRGIPDPSQAGALIKK